jgi:hypothetical protein
MPTPAGHGGRGTVKGPVDGATPGRLGNYAFAPDIKSRRNRTGRVPWRILAIASRRGWYRCGRCRSDGVRHYQVESERHVCRLDHRNPGGARSHLHPSNILSEAGWNSYAGPWCHALNRCFEGAYASPGMVTLYRS